MRRFFTKLGDLTWRSDTRHSEAILSWLLLGTGLSYLVKAMKTPAYLIFGIVTSIIAVIEFGIIIQNNSVARLQACMIRLCGWGTIAIHTVVSQSDWFHLPIFVALVFSDALLYIKLYLLLIQRRSVNE